MSWWVMAREDITLTDKKDALEFFEKRVGKPQIMILPDDGGVLVYAVLPYCESCLDLFLKEYEERQTPEEDESRSEYQEKIAAEARENRWTTYFLQLSRLAPRGFPNLALLKDEKPLFLTVQGSVTVRPRAYHPPAHKIGFSPEVPEELRQAYVSKSNKEQVPDTVAFLYMDEKYLDANAPPEMQVTSLAGILVAADKYPLFRDRLLRLIPGFDQGAESFEMEVHASDLFRDRPEEEHFAFYKGLVQLVHELGCKVYRRGFNFDPGHDVLRKNQADLVWLCFRSMLIAVEDFDDSAQIWPVMEIDRTSAQDRNFAGYVRWMDHATAYLDMTGDGVEELIDDDYMVDNARFGDLHYVGKKSVVGCAVDCLVYLLHQKWLDERGFSLTSYKARLALIASGLNSSVVDEFVGTFRLE